MPIVDLAPQPITAVTGRPEGFAVTPGQDEIDHGSDTPEPGVGGVLAAAFRQGNVIASSSAKQDWGANLDKEPGFNPWDAIKGTKYEEHWGSFADIRSTAGADARKRQIDMEDEDRRTLAGAPWYKSFPAQLLAGAADIPSLLPGGAFVRTARGGISIARTAAMTGVAAGAAVGGQELALHATQELRTGSESAMNIGTSVFLGGLLGAAGAKLLSRAEWNKSVESLNRDLGRAQEDAAGFTAYHASPHDFDAFDIGKLGAGEGAQVYARGLYFAENPNMSGPGGFYERMFKGARGEATSYQVRILANKESLLDWDRPLSEQPAKVQKLVDDAGLKEKIESGENTGAGIYKALEDHQLEQLLNEHVTQHGEGSYPDSIAVARAREEFPQKLRAAEIPGVKYLDSGSRDAGEGTSNFVVFHHDDVKITHKNGEPVEKPAQTEVAAAGAPASVGAVVPETIRSAAIRFRGKVYEGDVHVTAAENAAKKLGISVEDLMDEADADVGAKEALSDLKGFVTSTGRYVDREEARKIAEKNNLLTDPARTESKSTLSMEEIKLEHRPGFGQPSIDRPGASAPASVGAAAHEPVSLESNAIAGRVAGTVAAATRRLNPILRLMQSPSAAVRDVAGKLFENSLYLKKNFEGVASEPAVETLMKEWNGGLVKAITAMDKAFSDYAKTGGPLKYAEFKEAVGRAMRRGDESDVPQVAAVAKAWRSQVFDPLKDAAIKAGLLPEDVSVDTATSYFSRMWNRNRLIGQEGRFKGIVSDYYGNVIGKEYEKATAGFNARMAKLSQEVEDLTLAPEQRAQRLGELETAIASHEEGGEAYLGLAEKADRLSDAASELRRLKDNGTMVARQNAVALRESANTIKESGGKELKDFMRKRAELRQRRRNVDLGAAGLAERSQQIMESLADLEEATQRSLGRLVKKGQKLERDLDKLDPEDAAERISAMRQSFVELASRSDAAADRADKALTSIREGAEQRAGRADAREDQVKAQGKGGGVSLVPFLAKRGGISADDPLAGDVRAIFGKNPVVPGHGRLIRKGGRKLDESREAAVEAGYLDEQSGAAIRDLLDAMDHEARGNKRYVPGEEPLPGIDIDENAARMAEAGVEPKLGRSEKGGAILDAAEAKLADRLEKHIEQQRARADRMETIASRLDIAEGFDREGAVAELRAGVEKAVAETSDTTLGRGERAQRLQERLAALDPKRIEDRVKAIEAMKKDLERAYYDRWEVKNLGKGVDPAAKDRPDFSDAARDIADTVYNTLTGRTESGVRPEFMTVGTRGPMKDRTFNIPDQLIEDFLEHDVDHVGRRYVRVMGADVEMKNKFGSVDMQDQLAAIRANYDRLRAGVTDESKLLAMGKQERSDIDDITALRDLMRGTRAESPLERNYAKIARVAGYINYIRQMGEVVLASLTDAVRPAMVHGLGQYMQTAGHLATNLGAVKMSIEEAKLAGNVAERVLAHRMATLTDIADPYASRGPVEAFMENMTNVASKWNGIRLWTDMMKSVAAVMTQNRILQGVEKFAETKASERAYLAYLGVDQSMAERIQAQVVAHGENVGGVRVANTEKWTDPVAVRTYRASTNKDLDSVIVQSSKADVPLFVHTPTGKALLQFQSFNLASHQRVMLRGLQESPARFIGGTIAMTAMGMFMTWAKAVTGNRTEKMEDIASNPGWWIGEGLDRSGVIPVPMELANRMEKITGANPIKGAMKIFDKGSAESQKNQNRNDFGSMLGPTFGLGQDIATVAGIPKSIYEGKDVNKAQKGAAVRLMPFNSYAGIRQMMNYVVNPPH